MRALLAILLCLWAGAANAQSDRRLVLLSGNNVPSWVLRAGGVPANVDMSFATGQYYGCSLASCLSVTRASAKTNLLPTSASGFSYTTFSNNVLAIDSNGLLIEETRTNQLLNSAAPVTQTTASLATGTYTLWVNGSGSAQMSLGTGVGCGVGTATNGAPVNFTITVAGTCIVTVVGSLNAFQLEAGNVGSSLIVTAGTAATRAFDLIVFTGAPQVILRGATGTQYVRGIWGGSTTTNHAPLIAMNSGAATVYSCFAFSGDNANNAGCTLLGSAALQSAARAFNIGSSDALVSTWMQSNYASSLSGAAVVTSSNVATLDNSAATFALGSSQGSVYAFNGYISRIALWRTQLSNTLLPGVASQ